jgi:voltage-gated potassium channel
MPEPTVTSDDPDTPEGRWTVLTALEDWLETPMLVLSFLWLVLVLYELAAGTSDLLKTFGIAIWIAFLLEFALRKRSRHAAGIDTARPRFQVLLGAVTRP